MKKYQFITISLLLASIILQLVRISNPNAIFGMMGYGLFFTACVALSKSLSNKEG